MEHLWPDWLNEVLPDYSETTYSLNTESGRRSWPSKKPATHRIGAVCHDCNTGWMARLEGKARPLMTPLILGRKQSFDKPQQRTLAAWAFKTAVIGEQLTPATAAIPAEHRYRLKESGEPPTVAQVFIAATDATWPGDTRYSSQRLSVHYPEPTDEVNGYVATLLIRHLALQVAGHIFKDTEVGVEHAEPLASSVGQIWPFVRSFSWPPGPILGPAAAEALTTHFATE